MLVIDFQPLDFINRVLRVTLEVLHDGIFIFRRSGRAEGFLHHIPDSLFVLIADTDALFHQELFCKRFFGDKPDDLFLGLIIQADRCTVDGERQVAALKEPRYQPIHIVLHKAVRSLHEAILHRLHRSFHVIARIHSDKAPYIIQRMGIALCAAFQRKGKLVALMEHLADLRLAHRCVNVGKLVVNRLHQPANGFIDPAADFFPVYADNIAIYIDGCFFQCFGQVELGVLVALPHFHALCLFDRLVLGKLCGSVFPKEAFDFQVGLDFRQELSIIGENDKDFSALTGHHPKCTIVRAAVIPRAVIHKLIEAERIAPIECRVGVALAGEDVFKNHLRDLGDDFRRFDIFLFDLVVDFLFLIG